MTTVEEVLRRHGYAAIEEDVAQRLDALLSEDSAVDAVIDMTSAETEFLARYGGVEAATTAQLADLHARSVTLLTLEATRSLNRSQLAKMLQVTPSRISHQVAAGQLYSYLGSGRRPLFPDWQLAAVTPVDGIEKVRVLPQLGQVLRQIPRGSHPVTVRSFMTTVNASLTSGGTAMSPRDWLVTGGDPEVVAEMASTLGEQV